MARDINTIQPEGEVSSIILAGSTNATLVQAGPCYFTGVTCFHVDATPIYIKIYNKATAPDENDTPVYRLGVPANAISANGSGSNVFLDEPLYLPLGFGFRIVTGIADNSTGATTASEGTVNFHYTRGV